MPKGYRNGFNPFRKGGKFASASGADASSDSGAAAAADALGVKNDTIGSAGTGAMNATIRTAAGRGPASSGGSGGSGGAPLAAAQITKLPKPDLAKVTPATLAKLKNAFQDLEPDEAVPANVVQQAADFYRSGVNGVAFSLLSKVAQRGPTDPSSERHALLRDSMLAAYAEAGIYPPDKMDAAQLLQIFDATNTAFFNGGAEQAQAYGVASALKHNDLLTALTIADGPEGAGVGWEYTREELAGRVGG